VPFYKELANQGVNATDIPVIAFSVGEEELSGIDTAPLVGHLAAWNYFMSVEADANYDFIDQWLAYIGDEARVTNDPMEAHYIGFNLWAAAVEKAGSADVEAVKDAIIGLSVPNLSGGTATMLPNHHISKPVLIGEILDDGQFQVVWETPEPVPGDAWSDYLPESRQLVADWRPPLRCGNYDREAGRCLAGGS
jgi:urea transport system substrate-binding protein